MVDGQSSYVSRAGLKLEHALREFGINVTGMVCADFGCNVGGFTDCLLQHGAAKVYAIDTGYGVLDWRLRNDPRVVVMERENALHARPQLPSPSGRGDRGEGAHGVNVPLDPKLVALSRHLRDSPTDAEQLMWSLLRGRRLLGLKFRRQHPLQPYVLDFYCDELKLAVELDAGQHNEPPVRRRDVERSQFIESHGIKLLRFWNHDVLQNTDAVLEALCLEAQRARVRSSTPSPPTPLPEGEGRCIDLVVIDLGWTPQRHAIPAALRWLAPSPPPSEGEGQGVGGSSQQVVASPGTVPASTHTPAPSVGGRGGFIITLIKPHYELSDDERRELLHDGVLASVDAERICRRVLDDMPALGVEVMGVSRSPITGGKSAKKAKRSRELNTPVAELEPGNIEFLALLRRH